MSGWTEPKASGAPLPPETPEPAFTLEVARRMVPLVQRIIRDLLIAQKRVLNLRHEKRRLDQRRHSLAWPDRRRRYFLEEELAEQQDNLHDALAELEVLGLILFDRRTGRVGFPTTIHKRRAFFVWQPEDETVRSWRFAGDRALRTIPSTWLPSKTLETVRQG